MKRVMHSFTSLSDPYKAALMMGGVLLVLWLFYQAMLLADQRAAALVLLALIGIVGVPAWIGWMIGTVPKGWKEGQRTGVVLELLVFTAMVYWLVHTVGLL